MLDLQVYKGLACISELVCDSIAVGCTGLQRDLPVFPSLFCDSVTVGCTGSQRDLPVFPSLFAIRSCVFVGSSRGGFCSSQPLCVCNSIAVFVVGSK